MTTYVARWGNPSRDITTEIELEAMSLDDARSRATQLAAKYGITERLTSVRVKGQTYAETASQRRFSACSRARASARKALRDRVPA